MLGEQDKKHKENLDRFSALVTQQEKIAQSTRENINRTFNQFGDVLNIELDYLIPANIEPLKSYARELDAKPWEHVIEFKRGELVTDTVHWVRVALYFYRHRVTREEVGKLDPDLSLYVEEDFPPPENAGTINFLYLPKEKSFSFLLRQSKPFSVATESGIRSWTDFHGATSVIIIQAYESNLKFRVRSLKLITLGLPPISIEGYQLVPDKDNGNIFLAKTK